MPLQAVINHKTRAFAHFPRGSKTMSIKKKLIFALVFFALAFFYAVRTANAHIIVEDSAYAECVDAENQVVRIWFTTAWFAEGEQRTIALAKEPYQEPYLATTVVDRDGEFTMDVTKSDGIPDGTYYVFNTYLADYPDRDEYDSEVLITWAGCEPTPVPEQPEIPETEVPVTVPEITPEQTPEIPATTIVTEVTGEAKAVVTVEKSSTVQELAFTGTDRGTLVLLVCIGILLLALGVAVRIASGYEADPVEVRVDEQHRR